ncbi:MAG: hypothetical protein OXB92_16650, partial [Acidimicrobiaceae bacterium]|nr:hypothetical protein [Acidimicrobiaceae bacterium]
TSPSAKVFKTLIVSVMPHTGKNVTVIPLLTTKDSCGAVSTQLSLMDWLRRALQHLYITPEL